MLVDILGVCRVRGGRDHIGLVLSGTSTKAVSSSIGRPENREWKTIPSDDISQGEWNRHAVKGRFIQPGSTPNGALRLE